MINFIGLWGTYTDAIDWISRSSKADSKKMFLWLGSSIGNFHRHEASLFMKNVCKIAMLPGDLFISGIDGRNSFEVVSKAYNDSANLTRDFIMTGLDHINEIIKSGSVTFDREKFNYVSIYNEPAGRHEAYYESTVDQLVQLSETNTVALTKGELINVEYRYLPK